MEANVKKLLEAEKRANDLVGAAIKEKQKKLKEARRVAEEKIEQYKEELERDFAKKKKERFGDLEDQTEQEKETEFEIKTIRQDYKDNQESVVDFLIENVLHVSLDIPRVVRGDFTSEK